MIPLVYEGKGVFRISSPYHAARVDKLFGKGELVDVEPVQERSAKSHAHYFALITEAWRTLPESLADDFPSSEHLRKRALIEAGYCTETRIAFKANSEAIAAAAFIKTLDGYALCAVAENILIVRRAESQSMKAMKKERFQKSKDDVLSVIAQLLHADPASIEEAA